MNWPSSDLLLATSLCRPGGEGLPNPLFSAKPVEPQEDALQPPVPPSEQEEDISLVTRQLRKMGVDTIIDEVLPVPHGNRQGLSYGQLAVGYLAYILTECDHRLSALEVWAQARLSRLRLALGASVGPRDFTDDRIEDLLSRMGNLKARHWEEIEGRLGRHLIRAYNLPLEMVRIESTHDSAHPPAGGEETPIRYSPDFKPKRPDLGQLVELLEDLDPAGLPLATATLPTEPADDASYLQAWRSMVKRIGQPDFLLVADGNFSSLSNRAQVQEGGGFYLAPMPAIGEVPDLLRQWVLHPPSPIQPLRPFGEPAVAGERWLGFEVYQSMRWGHDPAEKDPQSSSGQAVEWTERWLLIHDQASADRELAELRGRLKRAEEALEKLVERPGTDPDTLAWKARAVLCRFGVAPFFSVSVEEQVQRTQRYVGRGRPGPNRPMRWSEERKLQMSFARKAAALEEFERLAGWSIDVTNVSAVRLSLSEALRYRTQWHPERGSSRLRGCLLFGAPVSLRDPGHIRGLMVLLWIALWMMVLVESGGTSLPAGPPSAGQEESSSGPGPEISTSKSMLAKKFASSLGYIGSLLWPPLGRAPFGSIQEIYRAIHWGLVNAGQAPHLSNGSMPNLMTPIWFDFSLSRMGSESTKPKFLRSLSISSFFPVKNSQPGFAPKFRAYPLSTSGVS